MNVWIVPGLVAFIMSAAIAMLGDLLILRRPVRRALESWFAVAVFDTVAYPLTLPGWVPGAASALSAVTAAGLWWWNRRRRDPARRTLGAKARAIRDAIVRKAREAAKPRPVLQPGLGGAR